MSSLSRITPWHVHAASIGLHPGTTSSISVYSGCAVASKTAKCHPAADRSSGFHAADNDARRHINKYTYMVWNRKLSWQAHEFEHPKPSIWIPPDSRCTCPDCSSWRCILPVIVYCEIKQRKQKQHPKHYFPMTYVTYRGAAREAGWRVGWHPTNPRNPQHSPGTKKHQVAWRDLEEPRERLLQTYIHTCIHA